MPQALQSRQNLGAGRSYQQLVRRRLNKSSIRPFAAGKVVQGASTSPVELTIPGNNTTVPDIHVFGVTHTGCDDNIGRFILEHRPAAVVVETALSAAHGSTPGSTFSSADFALSSDVMTMTQTAAQLATELEGAGGNVGECSVWKRMQEFSFPSEQFAYVAALAVSTPLVHCDRPKDITLRRLWALPSAAELDYAIERQSTANYLIALNLPQTPDLIQPAGIVEQILMTEREAVMCSVFETWRHRAAMYAPLVDGQVQRQAPDGGQRPLVAVVGASHIPGIQRLWESGEWKQMAGDLGPSSPAMQDPGLEGGNTDSAVKQGVRRALLERLLRLSAPPQVVMEAQNVLGEVAAAGQAEYQMTKEIYGSCRMMLAMLPRDLLKKVASGWECDMWDVLAPLRLIRPSKGGCGYCPEQQLELRSLYIEVS